MTYYLIKIVVTVALVVLISEIAKRSSFLGAILASMPLVSVLAITWLYIETGKVETVRALSIGVFWLAIPSLAFFLALPALLKQGLPFYPAMGISLTTTALCYWLMVVVLTHFGIRL
jgi:hypothetical protein